MSHRIAQRLLVAGLLAAFLVALPRCRPPAPAPEATTALPREEIGAAETSTPATAGAPVTLPASPTPAPSPTPVAAIPTSSPIPSPIPLPTPAVRVACGPDLPARVADLLRAWAAEEKVAVVGEEGGSAGLSWDLQPGPDGRLFNERIYVPVQRFATLREEITLDELRGMWESASGAASGSASGATSGGPRLLVTEETAAELALLWGWPQAGSQPSVDLVADDELTDALWADEQAVGLVPFERLEPRLKPLRIGTLSVVDNRLQQPDWPLAVRVWLHGWEEGATGLPPYPGESNLPASNRDPAKLTVLVMTGVTAMSRTTAWKMEVYEDYAYPAHVIGTELAAADITHISNEVPFVQGCVASPTLNLLTLCSKPEYLAALDEVGVDIVGLTGNHQNDFGREAALDSLKIYADRALPVYGGGPNDEKARAPLFGTDHGNRLAFLGANSHGPEAAWATVDGPGSARFDLETMQADIAAVRSQVDLVLECGVLPVMPSSVVSLLDDRVEILREGQGDLTALRREAQE